MDIKIINDSFSISAQISLDDLDTLVARGVEVLICNRPDKEAADQPSFANIQTAASARGLTALQIAFKPDNLNRELASRFGNVVNTGKKIHAYCRTGNRSVNIWAVAQLNQGKPLGLVVSEAAVSGFEVAATLHQAEQTGLAKTNSFDVVIVGAGSGGIASAASIRKRNRQLRIALIDPSESHYYQPGWTMVGAGVFKPESTRRAMRNLIPEGITWLKQPVVSFEPKQNRIFLEDGNLVSYQQLVVSPGLKLNWSAIEGLEETLGRNGVTSNYRYDLAPYTWELVRGLRSGKAVFTQPSMPIKCAGAPQKVMYLSADYWLRSSVLNKISIDFHNAGGVLFGIAYYVPALMSYVEKYKANLHFGETLIKVDGKQHKAWFACKDDTGMTTETCVDFDILHVCPPQCAPDFISNSPLADANGWLDVDPKTLRHKRFKNIWGLGDACNAPNAKTMAAVRKQAPVVARNLLNALRSKPEEAEYDGYGSCPLTVERGKVVLAEFGYGGKLLPTFPAWLNNSANATRFAWILKTYALPAVYWQLMLKGREWLT
jgi:sulfide:quinone oxidoreductase